MCIPGWISGGPNWAVANNYDVVLTTEVQKFGLGEIRMAFNLLIKEEDTLYLTSKCVLL